MRNDNFGIFSSGISYLIRCVQQLRSIKMTEYALKGTTAVCLCQIWKSEGGLSAGELAKQGEIDKAQVSRCMAELTELGFVFRDDKDGKQYRQKYRLTEKGSRAAQDIVQSTQELRERILKNVSEKDMDTFYHVLEMLCQNLSELDLTKNI